MSMEVPRIVDHVKRDWMFCIGGEWKIRTSSSHLPRNQSLKRQWSLSWGCGGISFPERDRSPILSVSLETFPWHKISQDLKSQQHNFPSKFYLRILPKVPLEWSPVCSSHQSHEAWWLDGLLPCSPWSPVKIFILWKFQVQISWLFICRSNDLPVSYLSILYVYLYDTKVIRTNL